MQAGVKERYDAFAEAYVANACNGAMAARIAGYSVKRDFQTANRLVSISYVKDKIAEIKAKIKVKCVATKQQRQEFWSETYQDKAVKMADRLRSSELLGKSECDFVEKHVNLNIEVNATPEGQQKALGVACRAFKEELADV